MAKQDIALMAHLMRRAGFGATYEEHEQRAAKWPLQEKMTLFWHGIFCTGNSKCEHPRQMQVQLEKFRRHSMGSLPDILLGLASDPAMVFYLDNCMSHKDAINENWGRELLELFSMGVGNYTEEDVKVCGRGLHGVDHYQSRTSISL